jgi:hypothetical protein
MDNESRNIWDALRRSEDFSIPSRYKENDICYFQPDLSKISTPFGGVSDNYTGSIACQIIAIKFDTGKVLYDIAIYLEEDKTYYTSRPIKEVDSVFITPS